MTTKRKELRRLNDIHSNMLEKVRAHTKPSDYWTEFSAMQLTLLTAAAFSVIMQL